MASLSLGSSEPRGVPSSRQSRICMPTTRLFNRRAYQCSLHEAEDVLVEVDDVDLIRLEPKAGFRRREKLQRRLTFRDFSGRLVFMNPGLRSVTLTRDYDLFVAVCQNHWDLLYINAVKGWKDRCRTSVCWLDEIWAADVHLLRHWLPALRAFDYVFIGCRGTVELVAEAIGRPCRWLPGAVDLLRFTPLPNPPQSAVDIYSIGRRWEGMHQALLRESRRRALFYVHDTFPGMANLLPFDSRQHRNLFANIAKRSRYFVVAPAKMNVREETQGQVEIGFRYFEGAAAGTVMIGDLPDCNAFREAFPWPDAVVPVAPDGSDVAEVLAALDDDRERVLSIGRRNAAQSLLRHDWVHRWKEIFQVTGIEASPALLAREAALRDLAEGSLQSTSG
jgi:Glycosyl transferases group 1